MNRLLLMICVAVGSLLGLPGIAAGQTPGQDSVVGSGISEAFSDVRVDVRSGPSGENPGGEASVTLRSTGEVFASSSVDCLVVSGSTATYAGTLLPNSFGFTSYRITVEDTGLGASAPDSFGFALLNSPLDCSQVTGTNIALTGGDLVVTDAQPLPTTRDACKNGGWRDYGTAFKNDGQCVAFVQRGPKA